MRGGGVPTAPPHLAQVLRVHAGGERRRTDQVREHHRDLAAFGDVLGLRLRSGGGSRCHLGRIYVLADSGKYLPSGSERDPHVLQILIGQVGEYGNVNLILSKSLSVLPKTELFEPVCNLLHRGH